MRLILRNPFIVAITLVIAITPDQLVAADTGSSPLADSSSAPVIRSLQRTEKMAAAVNAPKRDPFFGQDRIPVMVNDSAASAPATAATPVAPAFPTFRIVGKQQDDNGWSVFIISPRKPGQVWVVREGESFDETFRVSKLAPPVLIVKSTQSRQSRTFDIGKDEE